MKEEETLDTEDRELKENSWAAEHPWIALAEQDADLDADS